MPDDTPDGIAKLRHDLRTPLTVVIGFAEILSGELARGERLPGEHALASRFEVSRATVRQALAELQRRGYIATSSLSNWKEIGDPPVVAVIRDVKEQREAVRLKQPLLAYAPDCEQAEAMRTIARVISSMLTKTLMGLA